MMFIFTLLSMVQASPYNPTWSELKSEDGWVVQDTVQTSVGKVVVSKKMVDNFPCFRGVTEYPQALDVSLMIDIASNAEAAMDWSSAGVSEAETLGRTSDYVDYYQYLDLFYPMADRFWFLRGHFERDGDIHYFRWEALEDGGPYKAKYKQIITAHPSALQTEINLGSWILYVHDGQTHVEDRLCSHPSGKVPLSLQSIATSQTLPTNVAEIILETKRRMSTP